MKKQWLALFISALVFQAGALTPASAETAAEKAFKKQHTANKHSDKAALARTDARVARRQGDFETAYHDLSKAHKESAKAYKNSQEAKTYRSIARHGRYYHRVY